MDIITYTDASANLARMIEQVCEDHAPVIIIRDGNPAVVMMSLEDYRALEETVYLLHNPENARRLLTAIFELENGKGKEKELIEE